MASLVTGTDIVEQHFDQQARLAKRGSFKINSSMAEENLKLFKKVLDDNNVSFWLIFGTCLGAVRDAAFIEHDIDTDVGIAIEDKERVCALANQFGAVGFSLMRTNEKGDLLSWIRNDEYIDIYFWSRNRRQFLWDYWTYNGGYRSPVPLDSFAEINFLGEQFLVPANPELYLRRQYGSDWRTPKPGFTRYYISPEERFVEFLNIKLKRLRRRLSRILRHMQPRRR